MVLAVPYPVIDPVLVEIGPFAVRWYALAYIAGLTLGWGLVRALARASQPSVLSDAQVDDLLVWATLGTILGGRLGYVIFYNPLYFLANPLEIPMMWHGGMSFHGGLLGVCLAVIAFCRLRGLSLLRVGDRVAVAAPIGLFFGRLANFINGELFGRVAPDVPWAMVFPRGGDVPRHPSQLYEAGLEGVVLFVLLLGVWRFTALKNRAGALVGLFLIGYGMARTTAELFREPDAHIGFLSMGVTMGQVLSLPMIVIGLVFLVRALRRPALDA
ncbi:prolipoprotein diacylglyceryl transferase [Pararhodospirillum photometricum]|nr:prolipoprotein diacylglyceryl transferase [Pararhodospirillum photometricum]